MFRITLAIVATVLLRKWSLIGEEETTGALIALGTGGSISTLAEFVKNRRKADNK